jgi:CBS domain-containing protein
MKVADIMTREVASVRPETPVREVAQMMLERRISGVPVIDAEARVLGIVSEGDLIRRPEIETDRVRRGWLGLFVSDEEQARDFVKSHGRQAREVMTRPAVCVAPDTPLTEAVRLMERHRVKRLVVVEEGSRLAGLVSRADLVRAFVGQQPASTPVQGDKALRERIEALLRSEGWAASAYISVEVEGGLVQLWGTVESAAQREAILLAVRELDGVKDVQAHLGRSMPG